MTEPYRVFTALEDLESAVWHELQQAASEPAHAWRRCVVASVGPDGPEARTMVLRECDPDEARVVLYTDARSPKLAQWAADPRAQIVCWSAALGWQVRLRATVSVETEGLGVSTRWARVRFSPSAQDYLSHLPPGSPLADPPAVHANAVAHHCFAVVTADVHEIDWLALHPDGHRRARLGRRGRQWLVP
jgi:hypothetical protein